MITKNSAKLPNIFDFWDILFPLKFEGLSSRFLVGEFISFENRVWLLTDEELLVINLTLSLVEKATIYAHCKILAFEDETAHSNQRNLRENTKLAKIMELRLLV